MSMLTVEVYDYDFFGSDDLIGSTRVDLEDRWFDKRWTDLGNEHRNDEPTAIAGKNAPISWDKKPLELRRLFIPTAKQAQRTIDSGWIFFDPRKLRNLKPLKLRFLQI